MRKVALAAAAALVLSLTGSPPPAAAGWTTCHPALSAKGHKEHSMRSAMESAKYHWHEKAEHKYGDHYDDWYWSGDRTISCSWDAPGKHFWCTATARPCGR